jgi:NAD dependent epimerase/dehydratase family enzyme
MKVVIAGGSGLIGRHVVQALLARGDRPVVLGREPRAAARRLPPECEIVRWDPSGGMTDWEGAFEGAEAVHQPGRVEPRCLAWTAGRRRELVESRLRATAAIVDGLASVPLESRPRVLVSASGTDVYEGRGAVPATEETPPATTFLASLCVAWEAAAHQAEPLGVRVVTVRCSPVVSPDAPALAA